VAPVINETDGRDRAVANLCRKLADFFVSGFGRAIENAIAMKGSNPCGIVIQQRSPHILSPQSSKLTLGFSTISQADYARQDRKAPKRARVDHPLLTELMTISQVVANRVEGSHAREA